MAISDYIYEYPHYALEAKTHQYSRGRAKWLYFLAYPLWKLVGRGFPHLVQQWDAHMFYAYTERKYFNHGTTN